MKKLAILLSLVMVLGLATSAMAAELSTTGYVKYGFEKVGEDELFESFYAVPDWRVQVKAAVDETLSLTFRFDDNGETVDLQRAFFTKDFGGFSVSAGEIAVGGAGNYFSNSMSGKGVSAKVPFELGSVSAMVRPSLDPDAVTDEKKMDLAFTGDVKVVEGVKVYGDITMVYDEGTEKYKNAYAFEGEYAVADFTFYGEVLESNKDADGFEGMVVGATTSLGGFDLTGEYTAKSKGLEVKTFYVNAETNIGGVLYGAEFTTDDDATPEDDAIIGAYAKVSF